MDKYELNIKLEQMRKLIKRKEYNTASKIADTIEWNKIKNNQDLLMAADVYEASGKLVNAREVLLYAYERTNLGRQIVYRLCRVATKLGDIDEAEEFYGEYVKMAPGDNARYILQYELARAKGNNLDTQIAILSKYLDEEMDDRWAYELAKLYHKAERGQECAKMCDTIILWFSDGKYVDRALELKSLYAPLTKEQRSRVFKESIIPVIDRTDEVEDAKMVLNEMQGINPEEIKVTDYSNKVSYDTVNIQKELAESMKDLFGEEFGEEESVTEVVEEASEPVETPEDLEKTKEVRLDTTKVFTPISKQMLGEEDAEDEEDFEAENFVAEEENEEEIPEEIVDEDHIEGQYTIDEMLAMFNLDYNEPDDVVDDSDELEEVGQLEEVDEQPEEESEEAEEIVPEITEEIVPEVVEEIAPEVEEAPTEEVMEETEENEEVEETEDSFEEELAMAVEDVMEDNEEVGEEMGEYEEIKEENSVEEIAEEAEEEIVEEASDATADTGSYIKRNLSADAKQELKDFISRFAGVKGIDKQILKAMHSVLKTSADESNFIFIIGDVKSGKTTLAIDMIKVLNKIMENRGRKIAKVPGSSLTGKSMDKFMEKVVESDIVVEKVSSMGEESLTQLVKAVKECGESKIVIFEDEVITSEKFVRGICEQMNVGDNIIVLKQSRVREWAEIAKDYIKEEGYEIDEMGILAMHESIDKLHALTIVIQRNHVEQVIDRAIARHNKKKLSNLFRGSNNNILTEKDFIDE